MHFPPPQLALALALVQLLIQKTAAVPMPHPPRAEAPTPFISDNEIDTASGALNVVFLPPAHRTHGNPEEELGEEELGEEGEEDDEDIMRMVQEQHDGHRGWGYSARREGLDVTLG